MTHKDTLQQILDQIQTEQAHEGLSFCVFDIDSTLLDVGPRIAAIIEEFAGDSKWAEAFSEQCSHLTRAEILQGDWGVEDIVCRLHPSCEDQAFLTELQRYWRKRFFSNDLLHLDGPYPGAVEFVNTLYDIGSQIVYLTGRDQHRMAEGTHQSLHTLGFPLDDDQAQLVLKPHESMSDPEFKRDWFSKIERTGTQSIWFFENEPANIELVRAAHEDVQVIFFDSTHSKKAPSPKDLPKVHHFLLHEISSESVPKKKE